MVLPFSKNSMNICSAWQHFWSILMQAINCFSIHEKINQFWHHQICTHYQNITSTLVSTIVFGMYYNFFIVWSAWLEICRSIGVFFFTRQNVSARKIGMGHTRLASGAQFVQAFLESQKPWKYKELWGLWSDPSCL